MTASLLEKIEVLRNTVACYEKACWMAVDRVLGRDDLGERCTVLSMTHDEACSSAIYH
jgi:hypothetical protein